MRQDLEDLVPCQHSSAWFRGRAVISAPWRHFEHWSLAPHLIPGGSYGSVLCKGQEQYFPPSLCVQQLWSVGFDCPYPAAALKWEVWLPLSNLRAVAEHFINSHNLICLQYKSHPGIILLRAGLIGKESICWCTFRACFWAVQGLFLQTWFFCLTFVTR